jgi:16S rRNA (guanine966-N2)-methyltransferase
MMPRAANRVRIIGGEWRSRVLKFPDAIGLRPTPDRVRETVFNWLGQRLDGKVCLDLFAGSGALGFEALSRGAASVVMVERSHTIAKTLHENAQHLSAEAAEIVNADAMQYLRGSNRHFDIVFLDPPFKQSLLTPILALLPPRLAADGCVYMECEPGIEPGDPWQILKQGRAGQVKFQLMKPVAPVATYSLFNSESTQDRAG